jgi:hypothetical protein
MIRKLLLPALLAGLLGGCVHTGYSYRDGYYYGQPSVEYRYYDYGYPYSYGYYPYGGRHGYYGYPHRYGYGYPYYPYYRYWHKKPPVSGPRPPHNDGDDDPPSGPRPPHNDGDDNPPPWRDLGRRRRVDDVGGALQAKGTITPSPTPSPQTTREGPRRETRSEGSRMGQAMQRTQETRRRQSSNAQEP